MVGLPSCLLIFLHFIYIGELEIQCSYISSNCVCLQDEGAHSSASLENGCLTGLGCLAINAPV